LQSQRGELAGKDDFYATDDYLSARDFEFRTLYTDVALSGRYYPFGQSRLQPELGFGVGLVFFSSDAFMLNNTHLELTNFIKQDLEAADDDPALIFPLRLALAYQLTQRIALTTALNYTFTNTDRLDGIRFAGNQRGNDRYGNLEVGFRLNLGAPSDVDEDGIPDLDDACPLEAGPLATRGCPDRDGDGVRDSDDRCPLAAGDPFFGGCPDTDKDGTPDPRDRCPSVAGPPEALGCPPQDTDGDGIFDHLDDCPLQPGPKNRRGCPAIDTDADGLLDEDDRCPERFGISLFKGCPDTDGDGIEDNKDACPNAFGNYEEEGCPRFRNAEEEAATLARQQLFFRTSSADLDNFYLMDRFVAFLSKNPAYQLTINGHSDGVYDEAPEYISELRAERVKRYLMDSGIAANRLTVYGHRDRQPLAGTSSLADQRRVAFQLTYR
jgi:outer membrane protein OmpA-like peptidoglycan-associated protein